MFLIYHYQDFHISFVISSYMEEVIFCVEVVFALLDPFPAQLISNATSRDPGARHRFPQQRSPKFSNARVAAKKDEDEHALERAGDDEQVPQRGNITQARDESKQPAKPKQARDLREAKMCKKLFILIGMNNPWQE